MPLPIISIGDPRLRQIAEPVPLDTIQNKDIQTFIRRLIVTMRNGPAIGLAAPQVGEAIQVIVVEDTTEYHSRYTQQQLRTMERNPLALHVLINPKLQLLPGRQLVFFEGCQSVPGIMAAVPRFGRIILDALDENGEPIHLELSGWQARILQHECDHLQGILYTDRIIPSTMTSMQNYVAHWKQIDFGRDTDDLTDITAPIP